MTTITERRGTIDLIAVAVVLVFAFAAWRGAAGAPIVAGLCALVAIVIAGAWLNWRRKPAAILAISPDEIVFGRLDQSGTRILRADGERLEFRPLAEGTGWQLVHAGREDLPAIPMIGFDRAEVRDACEQHGWTVD